MLVAGRACRTHRPTTDAAAATHAVWDADKVRDDTRDWLVERLGHPEGVLFADETGFLRKGA